MNTLNGITIKHLELNCKTIKDSRENLNNKIKVSRETVNKLSMEKNNLSADNLNVKKQLENSASAKEDEIRILGETNNNLSADNLNLEKQLKNSASAKEDEPKMGANFTQSNRSF